MFGSSSVVVVISATTSLGLWYLSLLLSPAELTDHPSQGPHSESRTVRWRAALLLLTKHGDGSTVRGARRDTAVVLLVEIRSELFTIIVSANLKNKLLFYQDEGRRMC